MACSRPTRTPGWRGRPVHLGAYPVARARGRAGGAARGGTGVPTLGEIGFEPHQPARAANSHGGSADGEALLDDFLTRIDHYDDDARLPGGQGPSYLGVHLRFGTVSIRAAGARRRVRACAPAARGAGVWLIGADLARFLSPDPAPLSACRATPPSSPSTTRIALGARHACRRAVRGLVRGPHRLPAGRRGHGADQPDRLHAQPAADGGGQFPGQGPRDSTGAGASATSREQLNDFDLAANNGGWQWAASSGCDAQPYFRIFNPVTQSEKFDPQGKFIRRYLPQLAALPRQADPCALAGRSRWSWPRPAWGWAETIRTRSCSTTRRGARTLARYAACERQRAEATGRSGVDGPAAV